MYPSKTFIPNTFIYIPSSPAFAFVEATKSKHKRNKGFSWLSPSCRTDQSAMASSPSSDSSHGRSVAPPHRLSKDVPGSDNPIPLSPQWLLSKPGESKPEAVSGVKITQGPAAELENRSNSLEIKESSPKIPKLHENCIHGVSQFPTSLFRVKKLSEKAVLPSRASALSAGYDLSSAAKTKVPARGKALIPTDLSIAIPQGTYARIAPRSGLAWKHSIDVGAGVIDADYRGPVGVILFNHSNIDFEVNVGDRVAQLIIEKIMTPDVIEVQDLDATPRGDGGFGSTGV